MSPMLASAVVSKCSGQFAGRGIDIIHNRVAIEALQRALHNW